MVSAWTTPELIESRVAALQEHGLPDAWAHELRELLGSAHTFSAPPSLVWYSEGLELKVWWHFQDTSPWFILAERRERPYPAWSVRANVRDPSPLRPWEPNLTAYLRAGSPREAAAIAAALLTAWRRYCR